MPQETIRFGKDGEIKRCMVQFASDSPEREEAIRFFSQPGTSVVRAAPIPEICFRMSQAEAQAYFDSHVMVRCWEMLQVEAAAVIMDADLRRLKYLPEIKRVFLLTNSLTDTAIEHLKYLDELTHLTIFSENVTDVSLALIKGFTSLRYLDMQGAASVTATAFQYTIKQMPWLKCSFQPK